MNSDAKGMGKVKLKRKPFLMIARKGKQRGYLKLGDGHTNSLSKFDIGGEVVQKGVKGSCSPLDLKVKAPQSFG